MLHDILDINHNDLISIVGAGGKTTIMFHLAEEAKKKSMKVLVTTTTAIYYPKEKFIDEIIVSDKEDYDWTDIKKGTITVIGRSMSKEGKLLGIDSALVNDIYKKNSFDLILVEADGANKKTVKASAYHEPVIPTYTTKVIGIIGLDCIGKSISDKNVYRPEIFCNITGSKMNQLISCETIINLTLSSNGLFKGALDRSKEYLILNKADNDKRHKEGIYIAQNIKKAKNHNIEDIILTSLHTDFIEKVI